MAFKRDLEVELKKESENPSIGSFDHLNEDFRYADIVILNGKIVTVDDKFSIAEGIAIKGERIFRVGTQSAVSQLIGPDTKVINVKRRTVVPGLIDAHLHPEQASLSELDNEIPDIKTIADLLVWIRQQTVQRGKSDWIVLPKFFFTRLKDLRPPTLEELDWASPEIPVFLNGSYSGILNSAAMKILNISKDTKNEGILKGRQTGLPTGTIKRSAFHLVKIPKEKFHSNEEQANALAKMLKRYNRYGITSLCSGAGNMEMYEMYREIKKKGELSCRIFMNVRFPFNLQHSVSIDQLLEAVNKMEVKTGSGDDWVKIGAFKIILDGGLLTGTAHLREPWGEQAKRIFGFEDSDYRGILNYSFDELVKIVTTAVKRDWKFAAHCTGGGGVDLLLDVFEEVDKTIPLHGKRIAIIHGNLFTSESIIRMKKLGIFADAQAIWHYKDADALESIIGNERIKRFLPFRSLIDGGVMVNGGSDHMAKFDANSSVNPYNPFLGIWNMVTRTTENGNVVIANEAISREEALKIYTINNAFASFEESTKGSIEVGKLADIVVLSDDVLTCKTERIKDIESVLTMVGGKIVYENHLNLIENKT